ncbi:MAG TPA: DapH/DapD/GlmU-related protein [Patescibacteria group bacterium]|nr:DapH/DapD/GlmU-related protein [Patescibacteria group bacterium]
MIAAVADCSQTASDRFACRGRDLRFWLARFFPYCRFLPLPKPKADFDLLFVFDTAVFPIVSEQSGQELRRWLKRQGQSSTGLYAPPGKPFFIVSKSYFKSKHLALKPGLIRSLRAKSRPELLEFRNPVTFCEPLRQPQEMEAALAAWQIRQLQKRGIVFENYGNFYLEGLMPIGRNSVIGSGVTIKGDCRIGKNVMICANSYIENSRIGDRCVILPGSVIRDSLVEADVQLGPYCHLRNGALVKKGAKIGNFVEIKKSVLGRGSKAMHLTYIGDARIGRKVNIGAGTITCNYDGEKKNPTQIGDNVFIGSGTELVAPVTIHSDSYIGAGSTITEDVPRNALAVARQRQKNISGWVLRKRKKKTPQHP